MRPCLALVLLAFTLPAAAQTVRLESGAWNYRVTGTVTDGDPLDLREDLGVEPRGRGYQALATDLGPRWLPELRLERSPIDVRGEQLVRNSLTFGPISLFANESTALIDTRLDDTALTARYPLLGGDAARLYGGLALRRLAGPIEVRSQDSEDRSRETLDEWFPQLHLGGRWQLPEGLSLHGAAEAIEYDGARALTLRAALDLRFLGWVGVTLGYQHKAFRVRSSGFLLDAELGGAFGGLLFELP